MGLRKEQKQASTDDNHLDRVHSSLRDNFVPLPKAGELLTGEQLAAIFCGDLNALRDVACLIRKKDVEDFNQRR